MSIKLTYLIFFLTPTLCFGFLADLTNCGSSKSKEPLYYGDVKSPYLGVQELYEFGRSLYVNSKRIPDHFFYDPVLKTHVYKKSYSKESEVVRIDHSFVERLSEHISKIISNGYANSVNLSDLGHGHFLLPHSVVEKIKESQMTRSESLNFVINHPELKIIYHSAERLIKQDSDYNRIEDPESRYYVEHRNIVGDFSKGSIRALPEDGSDFNTQGSIEGFSSYRTVNFSWNQDGCFTFKKSPHETFNFDVTFSGYTQDPDSQDSSGE